MLGFMLGMVLFVAARPLKEPAPLRGSIQLKSLTSLTFNKDGILFMADPLGMHIYAIVAKAESVNKSARIDVPNIDEKLGALLGVKAREVKIEDMAVNPVTQEIFLAVNRRADSSEPVLVKVSNQGNLSLVSLDDVMYYETAITDMPSANAKLPSPWHQRTMAITDMAFIDGELMVAGLSGEEFNSKLRRFSYPFTSQSQSIQLEIYHTSHDQYETNSPIETFVPFMVNGQQQILAGYGCSPIAMFSMNEIRSKEQLRGKTIAELGGGNRPIDMITHNRNLYIANSDRTLMRMLPEDINKAEPLTTRAPGIYTATGVDYLSITSVGVIQLDNLNNTYFVMIQRNVDDGSLNLVSNQGVRQPSPNAQLGSEMYNAKNYKKSAEYYELAVKEDPNGVDYYNMACSYSLDKNLDKAFESLNKAIANGFAQKRQYENDTDLTGLKSDPRWEKLIEKLQ
jgi:tetratricopeptide (TPR) repeat protein